MNRKYLYIDLVQQALDLTEEQVADAILDIGMAWLRDRYEASPNWVSIARASERFWRWWWAEWNRTDEHIFEVIEPTRIRTTEGLMDVTIWKPGPGESPMVITDPLRWYISAHRLDIARTRLSMPASLCTEVIQGMYEKVN